MLELCLVSVILFLSAKRVDQILQCCRGKFWRENPYALLILRARAVQLLSLVSKQIVVHRLCHVRHSLYVILLIKLYKNTVNCAGDLSSLHHVIATRNVRFDRSLVYIYTYLTAGAYGIYMTAGAFDLSTYDSIYEEKSYMLHT